MKERYINVAYAVVYFTLLAAFIGVTIARPTLEYYSVGPARAMSFGLEILLLALLLWAKTDWDIACVFVAVLGFAIDTAGMLMSANASIIWLSLAHLMLVLVIVFVNMKAHAQRAHIRVA